MNSIHARNRRRLRPSTALWHNARKYLADHWRKIIFWQMLLLLYGKVRNGSVQVKNCCFRTTYFLYHHYQQILLFGALLLFLELRQKRTRTLKAFWYKNKRNLDNGSQWAIRIFIELVQKTTRTTVDCCHKIYTCLVDFCQWTSHKFLELMRKGARKVRRFWHWTTNFLYYCYQQISFVGALLLFVKLLKMIFQKVMSILATIYNTFIANSLKILSSILLLVLIFATVLMNYQLYIERNQLQEERKLLQAERRELIAEWKKMITGLQSDWLQKLKEANSQPQDEGFIYFAKKVANILEVAAPFTKFLW